MITETFKQEKIKALLKNNIFGKKEIDDYVRSILAGRDHIQAKDILLENEEDYVKMLLIFLYSKSVGMHYDIELLKEEVKNNFVTFQNFKIKGVNS